MRGHELVEPNQGQASLLDGVLDQIEATDQQAANLANAIAMGGDVPALASRLKIVEERRQELVRQRETLVEGPMAPRVDWRVLERRASRLLADWRALLGRHTEEARTVLRELLDGPIRFTPIIEDGRRGYRFEGAIAVGQILAGSVVVTSLKSMASPGRIELPA